METIGNNKLIAEFLGWVNIVNDGAIQLYKKENDVKALGNLKYNECWNYLMQVVEELENKGAIVNIGRMYCEIKYIDLFDKSKSFETKIVSGVKINACNGAILELIKWYNLNK